MSKYGSESGMINNSMRNYFEVAGWFCRGILRTRLDNRTNEYILKKQTHK